MLIRMDDKLFESETFQKVERLENDLISLECKVLALEGSYLIWRAAIVVCIVVVLLLT